jgi:hypothetical protein
MYSFIAIINVLNLLLSIKPLLQIFKNAQVPKI